MLKMITLEELSNQIGLSQETIKTTLKRHKDKVVTSYEYRTTNGGRQKCLVVDADSFASLRRSFRYEDMVYYLLKQVFPKRSIQRQYRIGTYRFDFKVDDLLIEYDEEHHHSMRQKNTDRSKEKLARQHGFRLARVIKSQELIELHALLLAKKSKQNTIPGKG
jgi:very-short-patch-repair endonuclease